MIIQVTQTFNKHKKSSYKLQFIWKGKEIIQGINKELIYTQK